MVVVTVAGSQVERDVDPPSVVRERLEAFAGEVLAAAMNRPVQRVNGGLYLRGLLEEGARKSLEPLVARLGEEADYQSMQQFVADSPWDPAGVVRAVAERVAPVIGVEAWVLDDTGFPKDGKDSPGVKRQYSGTLGKRGNCQIGVSVHAVGSRGTVPLGWALYLPEDWCEDPGGGARRRSPSRLCSRPSQSSGSSWSSGPRAGMFRERRCSATTPMARTHGCAIAWMRLAASTSCALARTRRCLSRAPRSRCHPEEEGGARPHAASAGSPARADRRADRRFAADSAQTVTFRDGADGEPVTSRFIFARVHAGTRWREDAGQVAPRRRGPSARGMADRRMARRSRPADRLLALQPARRHRARAARDGWRACAGRWSSTTSSSRANSASTTTKAAPGSAGITTPRS